MAVHIRSSISSSCMQRAEFAAQAISQAAGVAAIDSSLTQQASKGDEFSHFVPARRGGPRNPLNGDFVPIERHALTDPFRRKFMPTGWRDVNPLYGTASRLFLRIPTLLKAAFVYSVSQVTSGCDAGERR